MVDRKDVAGWLDGPSGGRQEPGEYAGQRLGLPAEGPGRVAGLGARIAAYVIDAVLCGLIAWGVFRNQAWTAAIFAIEVLVLTTLGGSSAGQRVRGMRVIRLDGRHPDVGRVTVRTVLLLLLIPAVIYDRDGRGLHDRAAGTVLVHTR